MLDAWFRELNIACEMYIEARRLKEAAELEEMQSEIAINAAIAPKHTEELPDVSSLVSDVSNTVVQVVVNDDSSPPESVQINAKDMADDSTSLC